MCYQYRMLGATIVLLLGAAFSAGASDVTFEGLLDEMVDLEALTHVPCPAYTCKQFSSYDRRSTDAGELTDENWFANADCGKHLREEERNGAVEYVMMDAEGPGAIVRIWSANPDEAGIVRIYIDGAETPALEAPLTDVVTGKHPLFPEPISCMCAKGCTSYLPIPYAAHCKVTASKPNFYYHVNYRTYAEGTSVESFSMASAEAKVEKIQCVAKALSHPEDAAPLPEGAKTLESEFGVEAGAVVVGFPLLGSGAVYEVELKLEAENMEEVLRKCVIEVTVDDQVYPFVSAPVGDFFGTAPGVNPFQSVPCGVREDGSMYARWVMPYKQMCRIDLKNNSSQEFTGKWSLTTAPRAWTDDSLYFHAKWRTERDIPTQPRRDWNYVDVTGQGRFVGVMLHITNPVVQWWGEGDEKIYVDGEAFPSHFGTGSEDYYGYAWCCNEVFSHAYHNQPRCDGPGNLGHTCVSRFHILDDIPFTTSFRFDMEVWHWADCNVTQSAMAYWYARGDAKDNFPFIDKEDLVIPDYPEPKQIKGAIEGEKMRVVSCTGGKTQTQHGGFDWSRSEQLWWTDGAPGDSLELAFWSPRAGRFEVFASFTAAPDYGIADLYVNDEKLRGPQDFYWPSVVVTEEQSLGVHELVGGENVLKVTLTGTNAQASPARHMFGLDYVILRPAR